MRIMMLALIFVLSLAAEDLPKQIDPLRRLRMAIIQKEARIIELEACSEAGIKYTECVVDWETGTVRKAAQKDAPKPTEPEKP